jgi:hypothetical protein
MKVKDTQASQTIKKTIVDDECVEHVLAIEWQHEDGKSASVFLDGKVVTDAYIMNQLLKEFLDRCPMAFEEPVPEEK